MGLVRDRSCRLQSTVGVMWTGRYSNRLSGGRHVLFTRSVRTPRTSSPLLIAGPAFLASHQAQQLTNVLKPRRQYEPVVHALLVNGERRCRKRRISEGTDRDGKVLLPPFYGVVHGSARWHKS